MEFLTLLQTRSSVEKSTKMTTKSKADKEINTDEWYNTGSGSIGKLAIYTHLKNDL